MAEFVFKRFDYTHADSDKDRKGVHKKGDLVNYKQDGWSDTPGWGQSQYPQKFVVVKCPEISFGEAETVNYRRAWRDEFDYEILSNHAVQGVYTVRVFEKNAGASNKNGITLGKVKAWLEKWGCNHISATTNSVQFDFRLWPAAQSEGFWDVDDLAAKASFVLNSYNATTGVADVTVALTDPSIQVAEVSRRVVERGGVVTATSADTVRFDLERSDVLAVFRADVKRAMERVYKRHRYSISAANVDAIVAIGGIVTRTRAQLLAAIIDHRGA